MLKRFSPGEMVTALALVPDGLLVAAQSGLQILSPKDGAPVRHLGHPEAHIPTNRFNDGKLDSRGRFWVGTMALNVSPHAGALYRVGPDGAIATMETGLTLPNGIDWSPDRRTLYLTDTAERVIYAYDYREEAGAIANRRALLRFPDDANGEPVGMAVDAGGDLWVAVWDGWRICRFSSEGVLKEEIILPVPRPTSCVFGGQEGKTLYVTSARIRISRAILEEAPLSGAVFVFQAR